MKSTLKIAYLGPAGTFGEEAAWSEFKGHDFVPSSSHEQAFAKVWTDEADYCVVAVENSTEGIVAETYHVLVEQGDDPQVKIRGEIYHKINLHLATYDKVRLSDIKTVYTKDIAWRQCRGWWQSNLSHADFRLADSTAAAAEIVAQVGDPHIAAITTELATTRNRLTLSARSIQDFRNNTTRFFILGKRPWKESKSNVKTTLALILQDRVGAIKDAFGIIAKYKLDVRTVKVSPIRAPAVIRTWKDWFFIDVVSAYGQEAIEEARAALEGQTKLVLTLRNLGSYPSGGGLTLSGDLTSYDSPSGDAPRARREGLPGGKGSTLRKLILAGEGSNLEFKSSLRWNVKEGKLEKALEQVIVKAVAGFMNSKGGALLIGVEDNGNILGLSRDYQTLLKPSRDGFELHLRDKLLSAIGRDLAQLIQVRFFSEEDKDVCLVRVQPSPRPVWVTEGSEQEFYLRSGNQTAPLKKKETADYISHHWG